MMKLLVLQKGMIRSVFATALGFTQYHTNAPSLDDHDDSDDDEDDDDDDDDHDVDDDGGDDHNHHLQECCFLQSITTFHDHLTYSYFWSVSLCLLL